MEPAEGDARRDCWTVAFGNILMKPKLCQLYLKELIFKNSDVIIVVKYDFCNLKASRMCSLSFKVCMSYVDTQRETTM
jgi:hypothetical protein